MSTAPAHRGQPGTLSITNHKSLRIVVGSLVIEDRPIATFQTRVLERTTAHSGVRLSSALIVTASLTVTRK